MRDSGKTVLFIQILPVAGYPPLMNLMRCCRQHADIRIINWQNNQPALNLPADLGRHVSRSIDGSGGKVRRLLNKFVYALAALTHVIRSSPAAVFISDAGAAWIGCLIRPFFRGTIAYIEYDTPALSGWRRAVTTPARNRLARTADMVYAPNLARLTALRKEAGRTGPSARLANFPNQNELSDAPLSAPQGEHSPLRLYYQGTLVAERLPETLFEAISRSEDVSMTIRGMRTTPENGYHAALSALITRLGLEERVLLLDPLPAESLREEAATHHAGIAFFSADSTDSNLNTMWGASNKIYQYMAYGLLVIFSSAEEELISCMAGLGLRCDMKNADSIIRAFEHIRQHQDEIRLMREESRRKIRDDWNFTSEFRKAVEPLLAHAGGETR